MAGPVAVRIRKQIKRQLRKALRYALSKLDEPAEKKAGAARPAKLKAASQPPSRQKATATPYPESRSPRPARPMAFSLVADEPVDIGCVKVFRAENFPKAGPTPWLDRDDSEAQVEARQRAGTVTLTEADLCRKWIADGYVILPAAIPSDVIDSAWSAYEAAVRRGTIQLPPEAVSPEDRHPGRFLNPHFHVPELDALLQHPILMRTSELLLGREAIPFQTITSHKGSQQGAHSDSIHMTTYPVGFLTACWIAMEDIHPDSGPLNYFPKSHRAPYLFAKDVGISYEDFRARGYADYHARYEPAIRQMIADRGHEEHFFTAKKGDVLFWHANLVHGGSMRRDLLHSRKAMVCHYYAKGCVCYHDLSGSPSHVHGSVEDLPVCGASGNRPSADATSPPASYDSP